MSYYAHVVIMGTPIRMFHLWGITGVRRKLRSTVWQRKVLELQKSDGAPNTYMTSKADMMKKIETAFDKMDAAKKGMLNMKQAEAFLRELMKSGA